MTNKIMIFHVLPDSIIHVIIKQYLTLEEIYTCTTHQSLISKYFYHLCRSLVQREKKSSLIYQYLLSNRISESRIDRMEMVFFKLQFLKGMCKDFSSFVFRIFDVIQNDRCFLVSKLMRIYYIQKKDP